MRWMLVLALLLLSACEGDELATTVVERGEFVIDIETTGDLRAVNSRAVSRPRRGGWRSQIVSLAPEGSVVAEGDFLVQFDTAEATRDLEEKRNSLANAEAELASERATTTSSLAELESALQNREISYEQAKIRFDQMKYEAEIRRREQELELRKAELALQESRDKIESQRVVQAANLRKAELAVEQAKQEVAEQEKVLAALTLTAPTAGLVVYKEVWGPSGEAKVKVGDTPWPGQDIIEIPDLSQMMVQTKVNEVDIHRVSEGLEVEVTIDALADTTFTGKITSVATLAKREGNSEVKSFAVEVEVVGSDPRLRPGMTATCRIVVERVADAVYIPLESVFEEEGRTICYVVDGASQARDIVLGARNADHVIVQEGVSAGERVSLRDPNVPLEDVGGEPPPAAAD